MQTLERKWSRAAFLTRLVHRGVRAVMFSGEDPELCLNDWLHAFPQRAARWNGWGPEELLQLAGYLKGRDLQEWNLLVEPERNSYALETAWILAVR